MRKKILVSVLTLTFVLIALGTTTFAWFTLSNVATVSDIEGTVQAGQGLEVAYSMPGEAVGEYRNNLTSADWDVIKTQLNSNGFTFGAVSTKDAIHFAHLVQGAQEDQKTRLDMKNLADETYVNKAQGYLEFQIHFKSDTPGTINWTGYNFTDAKASNGARIAISTTDNVTYTNGFVVVQKPVSVDGNRITNGIGIKEGQFTEVEGKGNVIYWDTTPTGNTYDESAITKINSDNLESVVVAAAIADETLGGPVELVTLDGNGEASVTVRVWLEGWDPDTYDDLWREVLKFNLAFEKIDPVTP